MEGRRTFSISGRPGLSRFARASASTFTPPAALEEEQNPDPTTLEEEFPPYPAVLEREEALRDIRERIHSEFLPYLQHRRRVLAQALHHSGAPLRSVYRRSFGCPPSDTANYNPFAPSWASNYGSFLHLLDEDHFSFVPNYSDDESELEPTLAASESLIHHG